MDKIQRVSHTLKLIFIFLLILLPIFFIYNHLAANQAFFPLATAQGVLQLPLDIRLQIIKSLLDLGPMVVQAFIFICLIRILTLFKEGHIFVPTNIKYMRLIGIALIVKEIFGPFIQLIMTNLATAHSSISHQSVISLTTMQLNGVLTGLTLILFSWIMLEAYYIKQDNDSIC